MITHANSYLKLLHSEIFLSYAIKYYHRIYGYKLEIFNTYHNNTVGTWQVTYHATLTINYLAA